MVDTWIVVAPPMPSLEANRAFDEWREQEKKRGRTFLENEVRQDIIRGANNATLLRYWVRTQSDDSKNVL
ncbi:hypothetical protein SAMN05421753_112151 [Planctomicrobium piriforme]|uniref:Uncharacterized protein n=1 Tax=Planctomicrobium piriforme TaxID=1576369 RepID=A0A1I3L691_9PLAN|nr:hypothetical protein SAMN05421753_112151 [Planctomicrobium piriforme]